MCIKKNVMYSFKRFNVMDIFIPNIEYRIKTKLYIFEGLFYITPNFVYYFDTTIYFIST